MFTSYAQNFEDVILWRALKHIENGFYIDIGAQDPVVDSVSRGFYENGWRGLHAEATSHYAEKVRLARPDERVVQSAIGHGQGTISFFEIPESGLSTSDRDIAMLHLSNGRSIIETTVSLAPLSQLLDEAEQKDVHWLKIDVEGMETSVIDSWSPSAVRPWIVVVESTRPNSQEPSFEDWEQTLLSKGYKFAYFDGLSRYYVSNDHPELLQHFGPGPNVFDSFLLADTTPYVSELKTKLTINDQELKWLRGVTAEQSREKDVLLESNAIHARDLEALVQEMGLLRVRQQHLETEVSEARIREEQLRTELRFTYESLSWKLTKPLREANARAAWLSIGIVSWVKFKPGTRPRRVTAGVVSQTLRWIIRRPQLFRIAKRLLRYSPGLEQRLRRVASGDYAAANNEFVLNLDEATAMAEPTLLVLDRLERAYHRNKVVREV